MQPITINAKNQILGRIASKVAYLVQGKNLPGYKPEHRLAPGITIYNVDGIRLSGRKASQDVRRHHTGYPGGLKEISVKRILEKDPRILLRRAIVGMLAKNRLRSRLATRLTLLRGPLVK